MFFKFKAFQGPESYSFKDPDTGFIYKEPSKEELINRVTAYRSQNNLEPIEHLSFTIENYLCGLPENAGKCEPVQLKRGLLGYLKGGIAVLKNMVFKKFAPQEVAEARGAICLKCPHNVFPDRNGFIQWSDNLAYHALEGRKVSMHNDLGNCELCSCPLRVKVHTGEEIHLPLDVLKKLPDFCWQKK